MEPFLILFVALLGLPLLVVIIMYNGFISRRNRMRNAFASIDVQLKKRWDLVPNLVETVRGYATHEKELFESVIRARQGAGQAGPESAERFRREGDLGSGLSRVMMLAESYPDLKASDQFLNLQRNLTEIESQIAAARRAYNAGVTEWNEGVEMFPGSILASVFGFKRQDWFEAPDDQRGAVDVRL